MQAKRITIAPAAADLDGVCADATATGAATLSATGALVSGSVGTFDIPRHAAVTSTNDNSTLTFTVTGTDRFGNAITDAITGPNATTAYGTKNFKTITSVTVTAAITGDADVGSSDEFESQWIPVDKYAEETSIALTGATGGFTFKFQHTFDDVQAKDFQENDAATFDSTTAGTTKDDTSATSPVSAMRLHVVDFTTGTIKFTVANTPR